MGVSPVAAFSAFVGRYEMRTSLLIAIGIVLALGWLYFSAKLRTLRLRVPPLAVPAAGDPPPGKPPASPTQPGAG